MFIEKKPLALLLMCMILAGCATATYTSLVSESFTPSAKDPEVFFVAPDRPFQIIGLVEAKGSAYTTHAKLVKLLKAKARKKGADAIYVSLGEKQVPFYSSFYGIYTVLSKSRAYALVLRYKEGNVIETKKIIGQWIGRGTSTVVGEFTLVATINENKGGISGILTASTGLSGIIRGYIENNSIELLAFPSNPRYCLLKFVGFYDGKDSIKGQYSSVFCSVSEGGVIEMKRSEATKPIEQIEKPKIQGSGEI